MNSREPVAFLDRSGLPDRLDPRGTLNKLNILDNIDKILKNKWTTIKFALQ